MFWLVAAFLSNLSFAFQDLVAYKLSALQNLNAVAINTSVHLSYCILFLLVLYFSSFINKSYVSDHVNNFKALLSSSKILLFLYALLSMLANSLLYYAYAYGKKLDNLNPGIASTLSNCSLIISVLLPYFVYNSQLKFINILGIIIYLVSVYFLSKIDQSDSKKQQPIGPKSTEKGAGSVLDDKLLSNQNFTAKKKILKFSNQYYTWLLLCILSALLYGVAGFTAFSIIKRNKKVLNNVLTFMFFALEALIGLCIFIFFELDDSKQLQKGLFNNHNKDLKNLLFNFSNLVYVIAASILNGLGVITLYAGYKNAPNPGFTDAISNLYTTTQAILNWIIYGTSLNKIQGLGVFLASISITLLNL